MAKSTIHAAAASILHGAAGFHIGVVATVALTVICAVMVWPLPPEALIRDLNIDDSFYYYRIAANFAAGHFSTFDGVNATNGYHPAWAALLIPIFAATDDPILPIRIVAVLEYALLAIGLIAFLIYARASRWYWPIAALPAGMLMATPEFHKGMESGLYGFALLVMLPIVARCVSPTARPAAWTALAILMAILPWVRLEAIAVSLAVAVLCLAYALSLSKTSSRAIWLPLSATVASVAVYAITQQLLFDVPVPVSGLLKQHWSDLILRDLPDLSLTDRLASYVDHDDGWQLWWLTACALAVAAVSLSWLRPRYRTQAYSCEHAFDIFALALAGAYVARLAYSMKNGVPVFSMYGWYFVPAIVLSALSVPFALHRAILHWRLGREANSGRQFAVVSVVVVAIAAVAFSQLWRNPTHKLATARTKTLVDWEIASYRGTQWANRALPSGAVIGSTDAGVVGYFSRHRVINLDGLVNSTVFYEHVKAGTVEAWMRDQGIDYLANALPAEGVEPCAELAGKMRLPSGFAGRCEVIHRDESFAAGVDEPYRFTVLDYTPP